jgi:hypothetical protein
MKSSYSAPSIKDLGTLKELTAKTVNGCGGNGKNKTFAVGDGFGNAQTGCVIS